MSPKRFSKTHYEKEEEERKRKEKESKLEKKASGIRAIFKRELGFMAKGAKILPKVAAKKGKAWMKTQIEAAKEKAIAEREAEKAAKAAELLAFKKESIRQAKIKGTLRAKKRGKGARGVLAELGQIGERMSVGEMLGVDTTGKKGKTMSSADYIFGGKPQKQDKPAGLLEGIGLGMEVESITLTKKRKKKTKKRKR